METLARELHCRLYRTSVKEDLNVSQVFQYLAEKYLSQLDALDDYCDEPPRSITIGKEPHISGPCLPTALSESRFLKRSLTPLSFFNDDRRVRAAFWQRPQRPPGYKDSAVPALGFASATHRRSRYHPTPAVQPQKDHHNEKQVEERLLLLERRCKLLWKRNNNKKKKRKINI